MGLNKTKGNMYPWITHTVNFIKGKCPHDCSYCYMKEYKLNPFHFADSELKTHLGSNNIIFVGSSCDMFADSISDSWIQRVFHYLVRYPDNTYLFQSKNPKRFNDFTGYLNHTIWGTTIETNRDYNFGEEYHISNAPSPIDRFKYFDSVDVVNKMISIEPIMDFDLSILVSWIKTIKPDFVSIGADSKGHKLPEPDRDKTLMLIDELKDFTDVKVKSNLIRLVGELKQ